MIYHQIQNSLRAGNYNAFYYTNHVWGAHFHKSYEIIYVLDGAVACDIDAQTMILTAGDLALCLPYQVHAYRPEANSRYWVCVFSEDYVRFFSKQMQGKVGSSSRFCCSEAVARYLKEALMDVEAPGIYTIKSCLYALCEQYLSCVKLIEKDQNKTLTISTIVSFIEQHHAENITLSDIAGLLGYDYHYVSRYFHSVFHMTFRDFLNVYRLESAVRLMDETDKKLVEIAYASGFQSLRTFNRCFRNHFGVAPSDYRKMRAVI